MKKATFLATAALLAATGLAGVFADTAEARSGHHHHHDGGHGHYHHGERHHHPLHGHFNVYGGYGPGIYMPPPPPPRYYYNPPPQYYSPPPQYYDAPRAGYCISIPGVAYFCQ